MNYWGKIIIGNILMLVWATSAHCLEWKAVLDLGDSRENMQQQRLESAPHTLRSGGVEAKIDSGKLELSGKQSIDQMRTALFDTTAEWADFLGGPVELTLTLPESDKHLTLQLEARNTTGYKWEVIGNSNSRYRQKQETTFSPRYRGFGAPTIQTLIFQPGERGSRTIHLVYRRPFQKDLPIRAQVTLGLTESVEKVEISDPTPNAPNQPRSSAAQSSSPDIFAEFNDSKGLPASWDWRSKSPKIVPAVRDQGGCGSCWSFGTVGVMESAVRKAGGPLTDLSEQFLVNCNNDGWGCNGGLTANKYHYNTKARNQNGAGAVMENDVPYVESDQGCSTSYSHPYKLSSWKFITGSEWTVPTTNQIKSAIYTYGPITAGVCVDNGWYSYSGGVYSATANECNGYTNHQIILIGWNDATQSWILRNSWGSYWGENGYMRITYDPGGSTSRVGEGTSWVQSPKISQSTSTALTTINSLLLSRD